MRLNRWFLVCFLSLAACESSSKTNDAGGTTGSDLRDSSGEADDPQKVEQPVKGRPFDAIAEEACKMAGGECVPAGTAFSPENVLIEGINCRPGTPGIFCARKGGVCAGHNENSCCKKDSKTGKPVSRGRVGCDRGYPTCLSTGMWLAASEATCAEPLPSEVPLDTPSLWEGAVDVQTAGRWACREAKGRFIERDECAEAVERNEYASLCEGEYSVNFSDFGRCCIPKSACPDADKDIECCTHEGTPGAKICRDNLAVCVPTLVAVGDVREVPVGTCKSF